MANFSYLKGKDHSWYGEQQYQRGETQTKKRVGDGEPQTAIE